MTFRLVLLAGTLLLCACSPRLQREVREEIASDLERAQAHQAAAAAPPVYRELAAPSGGELLFGEAVMSDVAAPPAALEQWIRYGQGPDQPLASAAPALSDQLGLPVRVTQDAIDQANRVLGGGEAAAGGLAQEHGFAFQAEGKAHAVLDQLVGRLGLSWRYDDGAVRIYYLDTRTFDLELLQSDISDKGTITNASTAGGAGQGGGGGGEGGAQPSSVTLESGNSQTTSVNYDFKFFEDAERQVKAFLSPLGTVAVNKSFGTLTVRDHAGVLESVEAFVNDANDRLTREVQIELTIMTITESNSDGFGVDWNLLRQNGEFRIGANTFGDAPLDSNAITATIIDPTSAFAGSSVVVEALSKHANASVKKRQQFRAMNHQLVRLQNALQDAFVVGRTTTLIPDAGAQTTITTMQQTTGLSLTLLPRILDDDTVLLQVQGSLSTPLASKRVEADGVELELPRTSIDDVLQRARVKSGSTLVLTAVEHDDIGAEERGVGSPRFFGFGGGKRATKARRLVLILLTPRISS